MTRSAFLTISSNNSANVRPRAAATINARRLVISLTSRLILLSVARFRGGPRVRDFGRIGMAKRESYFNKSHKSQARPELLRCISF
jgi:hypothetical protein